MAHFQYLVDAINKKLVGWKNKFLSPGGRLILIKHVLSAIPIHVMLCLLCNPRRALLISLSVYLATFCGVEARTLSGVYGALGRG